MRGGKRVGAGRPKGTGKYGEATKLVRLPQSKIVDIQAWLANQNLSESISAIYECDVSTKLELPLYGCAAEAGFPSPADDHVESKLDLNALLIDHPTATFIVKASGNSMTGANINDGDLMIVDRSVDASHNDIVIAAVNGEVTVKRLHWLNEEVFLIPENANYKVITINENSEFLIWGVVTNVIHSVKRKSRRKICPR